MLRLILFIFREVGHFAHRFCVGEAEPHALAAALLAHRGERIVPVAELDQQQPVAALVGFEEIERLVDVLTDGGRTAVVIGHFFFEQSEIVGLLQIGDEGEDQPERAVGIGLFIDRVPAANRQAAR